MGAPRVAPIETQAPGQMLERPGDGERGRGEDRRPEAIEHPLGEQRRDCERESVQARAARACGHPRHLVIRGGSERRQVVGERRPLGGEPDQIDDRFAGLGQRGDDSAAPRPGRTPRVPGLPPGARASAASIAPARSLTARAAAAARTSRSRSRDRGAPANPRSCSAASADPRPGRRWRRRRCRSAWPPRAARPRSGPPRPPWRSARRRGAARARAGRRPREGCAGARPIARGRRGAARPTRRASRAAALPPPRAARCRRRASGGEVRGAAPPTPRARRRR